jgi:hypothetical protein
MSRSFFPGFDPAVVLQAPLDAERSGKGQQDQP